MLEKGVATLDLDGRPYTTPTISVLLENDDRVFRIERGTVVKYAVSEGDVQLVFVGSHVEMLVSNHSNVARVIGLDGSSPL